MAERRVWATPADLVEWLQLGEKGERKLREMRQRGEGPRWVKLGRDVRYAWADIHAYYAGARLGGGAAGGAPATRSDARTTATPAPGVFAGGRQPMDDSR